MVIIRILGGFASQLGKYVFGYNIAKATNHELVLDISDYVEGYFRPFMLEYLNLPNVRIVNGIENIDHVTKVYTGKQLLKWYKNPKSNVYILNEEVNYQSFLDIYPHMHIDETTELLKGLSLNQDTEYLHMFRNQFLNENSVAIHVRRGDFVKLGWATENIDQYKNAIGYFLNKNPNSQFVFFSNDIEWTKEKFGMHSNFYYVDHHNGNLGDLEDFFCMSYCKNFILNSSSCYGTYANYVGIINYKNNNAYHLNQLKYQSEFDSSNIVETNLRIYEENKESTQFNMLGVYLNKKEDAYKPLTNKNVLIISDEDFNAWKSYGLYGFSSFLCEYTNVLYVNLSKNKWTDVQYNEISCAYNMDGQCLNFNTLHLTNKKLLSKYISVNDYDLILSDSSITADKLIFVNQIYSNIAKNIVNAFKTRETKKSAIKCVNLVYEYNGLPGYLDNIKNENQMLSISTQPYVQLFNQIKEYILDNE